MQGNETGVAAFSVLIFEYQILNIDFRMLNIDFF
jgi:hypothetical protein